MSGCFPKGKHDASFVVKIKAFFSVTLVVDDFPKRLDCWPNDKSKAGIKKLLR